MVFVWGALLIGVFEVVRVELSAREAELVRAIRSLPYDAQRVIDQYVSAVINHHRETPFAVDDAAPRLWH
jgi:hypothetical protein